MLSAAAARLATPTSCSQLLRSSRRCFSTRRPLRFPAGDSENLRRRLPSLSDFPEIVHPAVSLTIKNWFVAATLIRPYFDHDFTISDFLEGAKSAAAFVSSRLSAGDYDSLKGLVEPDCLKEVRSNLRLFRPQQLAALKFDEEDAVSSFVYQIGILLGDEEEDKAKGVMTRHVEITAVLFVLRRSEELLDKSLGEIVEASRNAASDGDGDRITVLNYRFIRDFTKGVEPRWTINGINHFYPDEAGR